MHLISLTPSPIAARLACDNIRSLVSPGCTQFSSLGPRHHVCRQRRFYSSAVFGLQYASENSLYTPLLPSPPKNESAQEFCGTGARPATSYSVMFPAPSTRRPLETMPASCTTKNQVSWTQCCCSEWVPMVAQVVLGQPSLPCHYCCHVRSVWTLSTGTPSADMHIHLVCLSCAYCRELR
jgi:hypothetical protein